MFEIKRIMRKQINTKNGEKTQVRVCTEQDQWASCFEIEGVTEDWKVGDKINASIVENNGFFNIVFEKKEQGSNPKPANNKPMITFEMIYNKLLEIEKKIK
jgi:hypothetical protein